MTAAHESSETHLCAAQFALPSSPAVDFGVGALQRVPEHLSALGVSRAFLVTDRGLRSTGIVDQLLEALADHDLVIDTFDDVPANPTTDIAENAAARLRECGAGALIALGGGSSMDTAKGVALLATNPADRAGDVVTNPGLPLIAVPTTSGTGAETNGFGVLEDRVSQHKVYCGHDSVTPRVAVLDPALTVGLPVRPRRPPEIPSPEHARNPAVRGSPHNGRARRQSGSPRPEGRKRAVLPETPIPHATPWTSFLRSRARSTTAGRIWWMSPMTA